MWLNLLWFYLGGCLAVWPWGNDAYKYSRIELLVSVFLWPIVTIIVIWRIIRGN